MLALDVKMLEVDHSWVISDCLDSLGENVREPRFQDRLRFISLSDVVMNIAQFKGASVR